MVTLCAQLRVELHVFSRATTTRRMTTPGVVLGLHPETMRSVREDFFLHVPNDSRETIHGRAFPYRAFVPKGRRVVLARSLVGGRSFTRSKARGRTRACAARSTGRCARPVSFYRIAMSFPRVRDLEFSRCESPRLARLQRDETTRGEETHASSIKRKHHPSIDDEHTPPHPCARSRVNETTGRTNERATDGTSTSRASTR